MVTFVPKLPQFWLIKPGLLGLNFDLSGCASQFIITIQLLKPRLETTATRRVAVRETIAPSGIMGVKFRTPKTPRAIIALSYLTTRILADEAPLIRCRCSSPKRKVNKPWYWIAGFVYLPPTNSRPVWYKVSTCRKALWDWTGIPIGYKTVGTFSDPQEHLRKKKSKTNCVNIFLRKRKSYRSLSVI